ncbi:MAG: exosortase T [Pseudomonadota bacterium]
MSETRTDSPPLGPRALSAGRAAAILLVIAASVAAAEPLVWLVTTWTDPSYGSDGWAVALAVAVLAGRSALSPRRAGLAPRHGRALALVAATLALRIAGEVMAIGVLGGLALALDVLALGLAAGLHERERAVSPFWLSTAFLFALPLERILQRILGYPMQSVSAEGACGLLALLPESFAGPLACEGLAITLGSARVLVDLPCSGARGVLLQGLLFALLCAHHRPGVRSVAVGGALALVAALLANSLRIAVIAVGEASGLPLLDEPLHGLTGLGAILLAALPVFVWASALGHQQVLRRGTAKGLAVPGRPHGHDLARRQPGRRGLAAAALLCLVAGGLSFLPSRPLDAGASSNIALPSRLAGHVAADWGLSAREAAYYERFGGGAASAQYGPMALTVVESSAPLRHLHAPEECLAGLGFEVRLLSTEREGLATAHYRATSPDGQVWHVAASFVAEDGTSVPGIGEAAWAWLTGTPQRWRMIRRITPWGLSAGERAGLEAAARAALDLAPLPTYGPVRLATLTPQQHHQGDIR